MALQRGTYRALEDIVGPENISEEPGVLDSYAFQLAAETLPPGNGERFGFRPGAVMLPGTTEEVQAIVKVCNRDKIKFKALSTGWGVWGGAGSQDVVQIDLRRMNRILEINERNMFAVVEPYVISARLQSELMKRGLNCHIVTAGSNCSALPLCAIGQGNGFSSVSTSTHGRNILGVEWVLPTGDLLRLGSLGSGAGWFCGDGPGPSLRSIIRGHSGSSGGVGVFTKVATKIYHWPGPAVAPVEGVSPSYRLKPVTGKKVYCLSYKSWRDFIEAGNKIGESEIAYILMRVTPHTLAWALTTSNEEATKLFPRILDAIKGEKGFLSVLINANSAEEFDYQDKVLEQIVKETGLKYLPFVNDPDIQWQLVWRLIRSTSSARTQLRPAGGTGNAMGVTETLDRTVPVIETGGEIQRKYVEKGLVVNTGFENCWVESTEYGHYTHTEPEYLYDSLDQDAIVASAEMRRESNRAALEKHRYVVIEKGDIAHDRIGPLLGNYHLWLRKIKKAIDPNVASDPSWYITPRE